MIDTKEYRDMVDKRIIPKSPTIELLSEIDRLNAELAQITEANRWIHVSERLPELLTSVLTIYATKDGISAPQILCRSTIMPDWISNTGSGVPDRNVTHWRPLPSAPTGGGE